MLSERVSQNRAYNLDISLAVEQLRSLLCVNTWTQRGFCRSMTCLIALLMGTVYAAACPPDSDRFVYPVSGPAGSPVGYRTHPIHGDTRWHNGLDFPVDTGTPVVAAAGGTVQLLDHGKSGYGKHVVIIHPNGTKALYAHLSAFSVSNGQSVAQGTKIGEVGSTGGSTGPHLHFELNWPGGSPLEVDGQLWDQAAGVTRGMNIQAGSCMSMAAGPGGKVEGDPGSPGSGGEEAADSGGPEYEIDLAQQNDLLSRVTPNAKKWFIRTVNFIEGKRGNEIDNPVLTYGRVGGGEDGGPNLFKAFTGLGMTLTFGLFVYALLNANYFYRSDDYWQILGRLIIAAALILGTPAISGGLGKTWVETHDFTQDKFAANTNRKLFQSVASIRAAIPSFIWGLEAVKRLEKASAGGLGATIRVPFMRNQYSGEEKDQQRGRVIRMALLVIVLMYGLHMVTVYATGLVLIFAMLFLPVSAALLLWPGMNSYLTRWLSMVLTALAALVVSIIVYAMAMDIAFVTPLVNLWDGMTTFITGTADAISAVIPNVIDYATNPIEAHREQMKEIEAVANKMDGVLVGTIAYFIFNAIFIVVGMIIGLFLLLNFERFVAGFFGGAAAVGTHHLMGAAGFALGGLAASKGGANTNTSAPAPALGSGGRPGGTRMNNDR